MLRDAGAGRFLRGAVSAQVGLARIDLDQGDTATARGRLEHARRLAAQYGDRGGLAEIDSLEARYYQLCGDEAAAAAARAAASDAQAQIGGAPGLGAEGA